MSRYFEFRLDEENIKGKKIAWYSFFTITILVLGLSFTLLNMMPLKQIEVKVLYVEENQAVSPYLNSLAEKKENVKKWGIIQALNKYFVNKYINAYESYNFYAVRDVYSTVGLFSSQEVFEKYQKKFQSTPENPAIDKRLGVENYIEVIVNSITTENGLTPFAGKEDGGFTMRATVVKQLKNRGVLLKQQSGVVLISFGYDIEVNMEEKARMLNPLGFTVIAYDFIPDASKR